MDWYKTSQLSNSDLFLQRFHPISLRGLASEALKSGTFEDFLNSFTVEIKHGTYWHVTDDPNFKIDLEKGPHDYSSMLNPGSMNKGALMVTTDLRRWVSEFSNRGYAAEIDMSAVPSGGYHQVSRGFGNEFYISDVSKVRVLGVYPISQALRRDRSRSSVLPKSQDALKDFYDKVQSSFKEFQNGLV